MHINTDFRTRTLLAPILNETIGLFLGDRQYVTARLSSKSCPHVIYYDNSKRTVHSSY
jgi:hypothetical protein